MSEWAALHCSSHSADGIVEDYLEFGPKENGLIKPIGRIYGRGEDQVKLVQIIIKVLKDELPI